MSEPDEVIYRTGSDAIAFAGKVAEWLKLAPVSDVSHGIFYVNAVEVGYSGETIGTFKAEDDWFNFEVRNRDKG